MHAVGRSRDGRLQPPDPLNVRTVSVCRGEPRMRLPLVQWCYAGGTGHQTQVGEKGGGGLIVVAPTAACVAPGQKEINDCEIVYI